MGQLARRREHHAFEDECETLSHVNRLRSSVVQTINETDSQPKRIRKTDCKKKRWRTKKSARKSKHDLIVARWMYARASRKERRERVHVSKRRARNKVIGMQRNVETSNIVSTDKVRDNEYGTTTNRK